MRKCIDKLHSKDIEGFSGKYRITSCGKVISCHRKEPYIMKNKVKDNKYIFIQLSFGDIVGKNLYIHRLVAHHFIRALREGEEVDHIDGDKTNNTVGNLEIVTPKENHKRRVRRYKGAPYRKGIKTRTYPEELKQEVLKRLLEGEKISRLAGEYEIPRQTIHTWR